MKKLERFNKYALGMNIAILLFEIAGMILRLVLMQKPGFEFYTVDSNLLSLAACVAYIYFTVKGKPLPHWASLLKFTSVVALMVTFIVVITVLAPIYPGGYPVILFSGQMLYFHTICPILAFLSFILLEQHELSSKDIPKSLLFTLIYGIILIILNLTHVVLGPYPFLMVYNQPVWASIAWFTGILVGTSAMTWGILKLRRHK